MTITLENLKYWEIALFTFFFGLIALITLVFLAIYLYLSNKLKKYLFNFFNNRIGKYDNSTSLYRFKNNHNRKIRFINASLGWIEKILGLSIALFLILSLVKLLITDDTFAYTIITLVIFVMSNYVTGFVRVSLDTDKHIFDPMIKIGELLQIDGELGRVYGQGQKSFWLKSFKPVDIGDFSYIKKTKFPLSVLEYSKFSKFKRIGKSKSKNIEKNFEKLKNELNSIPDNVENIRNRKNQLLNQLKNELNSIPDPIENTNNRKKKFINRDEIFFEQNKLV